MERRRAARARCRWIAGLGAVAVLVPAITMGEPPAPTSEVTAPSARTPSLDPVHGAANEPPGESPPLAALLPAYNVPKEVETQVMVGTDVFLKAAREIGVDAMKHVDPVTAREIGKLLPPVEATRKLVNVVLTAHEAASVGLDAGHEGLQAELYVLHGKAEEMRRLVDEVKRRGHPTDEDRRRYQALKEDLQRLEGLFGNGNTAWKFFYKSTVTEASWKTRRAELRVIGVALAQDVQDFCEDMLGDIGAWLFRRLGVGRAGKWAWKGVHPRLKKLIGRGTWSRWAIDSRLADYRKTAGIAGKKWGIELIGRVLRPGPGSFDEQVHLALERMAREPLPVGSLEVKTLADLGMPARAAEAQIPVAVPARSLELRAANPLQAVALIQNVQLQPAALAASPRAVNVTIAPISAGAIRSADTYSSRASSSSFHVNDSPAFQQAVRISIGGWPR